jgi:hypothetical protein
MPLSEDKLLHLETQTSMYKETMVLDPVTFRLLNYVYEKNNNQRLTVEYAGYTLVNNVQLPQNVAFTIESPDKIQLNLNLSDYSFLDEDTAPFSIPANYKKSK